MKHDPMLVKSVGSDTFSTSVPLMNARNVPLALAQATCDHWFGVTPDVLVCWNVPFHKQGARSLFRKKKNIGGDDVNRPNTGMS